MKRFFYYFGWTIGIGLVSYFGATYQHWLHQEVRKSFEPLPYFLFSSLFPIIIGILLRLPKLLNEIRQKKQWTFDWIKFLAVGLPSFCILLMYVLLFSPVGESILPIVPYLVFLGDPSIQIIAGLVFGFILVDSLKKHQHLEGSSVS